MHGLESRKDVKLPNDVYRWQTGPRVARDAAHETRDLVGILKEGGPPTLRSCRVVYKYIIDSRSSHSADVATNYKYGIVQIILLIFLISLFWIFMALYNSPIAMPRKVLVT